MILSDLCILIFYFCHNNTIVQICKVIIQLRLLFCYMIKCWKKRIRKIFLIAYLAVGLTIVHLDYLEFLRKLVGVEWDTRRWRTSRRSSGSEKGPETGGVARGGPRGGVPWGEYQPGLGCRSGALSVSVEGSSNSLFLLIF